MERIYFDNGATTRPDSDVMAKAVEIWRDTYGNPSSLHTLGLESERKINESKKILSQLMGAGDGEIIYTSGGTESNNLSILGIAEAYKRKGDHIITTKAEHPSVIESIKNLENKGFRVTYLKLDRQGKICVESLEENMDDRTILVSLMHVNNETGAVHDIEKIAEIVKKKHKDTVFHVDGVQGFTKHKLNMKLIDAYSVSAHKIHGLQGTGALYIKKGIKISPMFYGGSQQNGIRPGTENTAGIVTLSVAAEKLSDSMDENYQQVMSLKEKLLKGLALIDDVVLNGDKDNDSPYIVNVSFIGVKAEVLLNALAEKGIYVSTGAACHARKKNNSVLQAYGLEQDRMDSAIRFSFSHSNTEQEIEFCLHVLEKQVAILRQFGRRDRGGAR